jgi:hypothetical protein
VMDSGSHPAPFCPLHPMCILVDPFQYLPISPVDLGEICINLINKLFMQARHYQGNCSISILIKLVKLHTNIEQ